MANDDPPTPAPGRLIATVGAPAILLALAFGIATYIRRSANERGDDVEDAATRRGIGLVDLPAPKCNPAAVAEVLAGREALRQIGPDAAEERFRAATTADPRCAEAHLRRAILAQSRAPAEAAASFAEARTLRADLAPREDALLNALAPSFATPPDTTETATRLRNLTAAMPQRDAEIMTLAATRADDPTLGVQLSRWATVIDPGYAPGFVALTRALDRLSGGALADDPITACLKGAPASTECLQARVSMDARFGRCASMERTAREALARGPMYAWARVALANALASQGASREVVTETLTPRWSSLPDADRHLALGERARIAILFGDFAGARMDLDALGKAIDTRPERAVHAAHLLLTLDLLEEIGETAEAASFAADQAKKLPTWSHGPNDARTWGSGWLEPRVASLVPAMREPLLASWRTTVSSNELDEVARWAYGDALVSLGSRHEAAEAIVRLPPAPAASSNASPIVEYLVARTQIVAERGPMALEPILTAVARCDAFDSPFEHVRADQLLGFTRASIEDDGEACRTLHLVVDRWGAAKPASATAKLARGQMQTLKCPAAARDR